MANNIAELRSILFDTLRDLRSKESPMDIERAKVVSDVAQTIINSAKVEVDHLKVTGGQGSAFIAADEESATVVQLPQPQGFAAQVVAANVRRHECK